MSANLQRLQYLLQQYLRDTGTPDELREFWERFAELEEDDPLKKELWLLWQSSAVEDQPEKKDWKNAEQRIREQIATPDNRQSSFITRRIFGRVAAAVIVLLTGAAMYFLVFQKSSVQTAHTEMQSQRFKNDLIPGGNKAVLTLSNGTRILLDSAENGMLLQQGNTKILKQGTGQLAYKTTGPQGKTGNEILFNTLSTPRGGQYKLTLPDGTQVWLNSASSIRFPSAFSGKARDIQITGEAYFEVTHLQAAIGNGKNIPFIVTVNGMKVEVLGTHFNINAYEDEGIIKTTLLQGSVKVIQEDQQQILIAGQQAKLKQDGHLELVKGPDLEEVMAWKNGFFQFQNDSISNIMRQVARWYDVDINYQGNISQLFIGKVPRNVNVSTLLSILESTGWVHFKINGREIIVEP
ncbi:FecR family protein [Chitinophaga sp. MM2321]|uniref:FecR family protein n=1 Tax=Chitinophaga sp. MM2321 TaxID=3137178 RepID=UPI0032D57918